MKYSVVFFVVSLFSVFSLPLVASDIPSTLSPDAEIFVPAFSSSSSSSSSLTISIKTKIGEKRKRRNRKKGRVFAAFLVRPEDVGKLDFIQCQVHDGNGVPEVSFYALLPVAVIKNFLAGKNGKGALKNVSFLGNRDPHKSLYWSTHLPPIVEQTVRFIPAELDEYFMLCCAYQGNKSDDIQIGVTGKIEQKDNGSLFQAMVREMREETSIDLLQYRSLGLISGTKRDAGFIYLFEPRTH